MAIKRFGLGSFLGLLVFGLTGCMSLVLEHKQDLPPVSLTEVLRGYRVMPPARHFLREVWVYHLLGLPNLSLGTREGLAANQILAQVLAQETENGQGVVQLKIRHEHTAWTLIASAVTLGVLVPTAVILEGDVVQLQPDNRD
jgi:hypothetical protein